MLKSRKDRSSMSLVCKEWYNAERWSRRNVFIELRLKRMTVTDESLKFLVRSFPNFKAISLQNCDGFSTDGLVAIAADCKTLVMRRLKQNFSNYEMLSRFLGMKKSEPFMIRLVVLMMLTLPGMLSRIFTTTLEQCTRRSLKLILRSLKQTIGDLTQRKMI
ncbi:transport inhibitor response 1-like protein Os11g0515500 [Arachis ipaensis]|uniref:transport inhibitor response 1-like protein Os11g0515500 n=1 Tax=Arachis ipaensis TaxID=130454 RepID=UPI000A2B540D|nr:transport inhibitor response 1-like protein Os11g0515500 [Arachis ipaensis]